MAIYVGTVRLDDLANRNGNKPSGNGPCFNNFKKVYERVLNKKYNPPKPDKDSDVPLWSEFTKTSKKYDTYDIYKLLNDDNMFKCRLQDNKGTYITTDVMFDKLPKADSKIDGEGSGSLVPLPSNNRKPGKPDKPTPDPSITDCKSQDDCHCQSNWYCCTDKQGPHGGCMNKQWSKKTCKTQCRQGNDKMQEISSNYTSTIQQLNTNKGNNKRGNDQANDQAKKN